MPLTVEFPEQPAASAAASTPAHVGRYIQSSSRVRGWGSPVVAKDPAVVKANPWLKPAIANVARVTRPTQLGAKYQQGSQAIYQGINQILNGQDAKSVLPRIEAQLNRLLKR